MAMLTVAVLTMAVLTVTVLRTAGGQAHVAADANPNPNPNPNPTQVGGHTALLTLLSSPANERVPPPAPAIVQVHGRPAPAPHTRLPSRP